ncbi:MAG: C4-dicarboxylate ABC transporter permease [Rhodobacterales bacterium]|nr:MAG: C4-dicarboxylate ABC transporter permease [Rhodobacterales bacterium]
MRLHQTMLWLAKAMAVLGGLVLGVLVIMTSLSVIGTAFHKLAHGDFMNSLAPGLALWLQSVGIGPVPGNEEIIEMSMAFAIYAFMPFCQITAGHATVDIFTSRFPERVNRFIQLVVEILFAAIFILITWRLFEGMSRKMSYGETTFFLQWPLWWGYAAALFAACASAVMAVYMVFVRLLEFTTMRTIAKIAGADH